MLESFIDIDYRDKVTVKNAKLFDYFSYLLELENLDQMIKQRIIDIQGKVNYNKMSLSQFRSLVSITEKLTSEENDESIIEAILEGKGIIKKADEMIKESMMNKNKGNIVYVD